MSLYSGPQFHSEPVSQPFGARDDASAWYPTVNAPASSVASMIVLVQSWCCVTTSTPEPSNDWTRSACVAGSHQLVVDTAVTSTSGRTVWAPSVKALMLASVCGI